MPTTAKPCNINYYCNETDTCLQLDDICNGYPNCPNSFDELSCSWCCCCVADVVVDVVGVVVNVGAVLLGWLVLLVLFLLMLLLLLFVMLHSVLLLVILLFLCSIKGNTNYIS